MVVPSDVKYIFTREEALSLVHKLVRELKRDYPIAKVVLFGSYARGEQEEFSDIDLLILLDCEVDYDKEVEILSKIFRYEIKRGNIIIDAFIKSKMDWNNSSVYYENIREGIEEEGIEIGVK